MKASVGPFTARPPTSGLTATTGARGALRSPRASRVRRGSGRSRSPGSTGRSMISLGASRAPRAPRGSGARPRSRRARPLDRRLAVIEDQELLQPAPARRAVQHPRAHAAARTSAAPRRARPSARAIWRLGRGQRAALGDEVGPVEAGGEVAVGEREPARARRAARGARGRRTCRRGCPSRAPRRSAPASQYVHQVRVGADEQPVDLDVVAGVGDHARARRRPGPGGRRRASPRRCRRRETSPGSRPMIRVRAGPAIRIPAWVL